MPADDDIHVPDPTEPAGYREWYLKMVDEGLREANDPNTVFYTQEQVEAEFARLKAEVLTKVRKSA